MEKTLRVSILGRPYPLRVRADDEAFTLRVATLVDERIRAIERQAPGHPDLTHAVVAALSLGEDLISALDDLQTARAELQAAQDAQAERPALAFDPATFLADADALADRLEAALGGGGDGAAGEEDLPRATPAREAKTQDRESASPPAADAEPASGPRETERFNSDAAALEFEADAPTVIGGAPPEGSQKGAAPPANPEGGSAVLPSPAAGGADEVSDPEPGDDDAEASADSPLPKTP